MTGYMGPDAPAGKARRAIRSSFPLRALAVHNPAMLRKRSVSLAGHQTSLALEPEFWAVLDEMARTRGIPLAALVRNLDEARGDRPLASACRVAALAWTRPGG
jgi:predicted DNA-binding ribbon-helix-helix protein